MSTAVYTHDEKGQRQDVHRPSAINPADYEYQHVSVNRKDKITGGPAGTCHHCGKAIVWEVVWTHLPSGNNVTFGEICTEILGMSNDRIEHEMVLLKRRAERERQAAKAEMAKEEKIEQFKAEQPDVVKFLDELDENESFEFLRDMKRSFEHWGSLTDRQVESVKKCMVARQKYIEQQVAKSQFQKELTVPLAEGRYTFTGEVLSHKWVDDDYYGTTSHKMRVQNEDGNVVYGTVARNIDDALRHTDEDLKGKTVTFTATFEQKKGDEHFGYFKRPSNATMA